MSHTVKENGSHIKSLNCWVLTMIFTWFSSLLIINFSLKLVSIYTGERNQNWKPLSNTYQNCNFWGFVKCVNSSWFQVSFLHLRTHKWTTYVMIDEFMKKFKAKLKVFFHYFCVSSSDSRKLFWFFCLNWSFRAIIWEFMKSICSSWTFIVW